MSKLTELHEISAPKLGNLMFAMVKLEDPTDPNNTILQHVIDTFTVEEMAAIVCDSAASKLEEFMNSNEHSKNLVGLVRTLNNQKKEN